MFRCTYSNIPSSQTYRPYLLCIPGNMDGSERCASSAHVSERQSHLHFHLHEQILISWLWVRQERPPTRNTSFCLCLCLCLCLRLTKVTAWKSSGGTFTHLLCWHAPFVSPHRDTEPPPRNDEHVNGSVLSPAICDVLKGPEEIEVTADLLLWLLTSPNIQVTAHSVILRRRTMEHPPQRTSLMCGFNGQEVGKKTAFAVCHGDNRRPGFRALTALSLLFPRQTT